MKKNVFFTGASGCVGHYIFDLLVANPDYHLYLLVRNPQKLMFDPASYSNVTVIRDDLQHIASHADLLRSTDYLVHVAAGWGETEANYNYTLNLFNLLDPKRCKKVVYFSTASLLTSENKLLENAGEIGTSYIRGKYLCYKRLPELKIHDRIITLFPTWVLGGDAKHPYSHATLGIRNAIKWLWFLRFFSADVSFHFIHAQDIAFIVDYLLKNDIKESNLVLGNALITADQFIKEMCDYINRRVYFRMRISPRLVDFLFRSKLSAWDKYCLNKRHFEYKVTNPQTFRITPQFATVASMLDAML